MHPLATVFLYITEREGGEERQNKERRPRNRVRNHCSNRKRTLFTFPYPFFSPFPFSSLSGKTCLPTDFYALREKSFFFFSLPTSPLLGPCPTIYPISVRLSLLLPVLCVSPNTFLYSLPFFLTQTHTHSLSFGTPHVGFHLPFPPQSSYYTGKSGKFSLLLLLFLPTWPASQPATPHAHINTEAATVARETLTSNAAQRPAKKLKLKRLDAPFALFMLIT